MARRPYGYPRTPDVQQQMQVTGVPYISMRDPNAYQDWSQILESGQQRYDVSQSAIAKLLDEYSNARVSDRNAGALDEIVEGRLGEIKSIVKDRYDGQYGNAANEIVQRMASARKPIMQAQQAFEMEQQQRANYQKQLEQGNAPHTFDETGTRRIMTFDEYHNLPKSDFVEGKFVAPTFKALRGAADITGYLGKNISPALSAEIYEGILSGKKGDPEGYLSQVSRKGVPDEEIRNRLVDSKTGEITSYGEGLARQLRNEVTFLNEELKDKMNDKQLLEYITPIIQGQVTDQLLREYKQDPSYKPTEQENGGIYKTLSGVEVKVPKENLIEAEAFMKNIRPGIGGKIARGLIKSATLTADPLYRKKASSTALANLATTAFINPFSITGSFIRTFPKAYTDLMVEAGEATKLYEETGGTDERIQKVTNRLKTEGNAVQRKLANLSDINLDNIDPESSGGKLLKTSGKFFTLKEDAPNYTKKEKAEDYLEYFSNNSISPKINVKYSVKKDLDELNAEDEFWFGRDKNEEPVLKTSMANNAKFISGDNGSVIDGSAFIEEIGDKPVQAYGSYSNDNPFGVGAKQVIIEGKHGPEIYAMIPTETPNPVDYTEWQFHNIQYLPEQEIEFYTPFGHNIKIENIATGNNMLKFPKYQLTVDGVTLKRNFSNTGEIFNTYFNAFPQ